MADNCERLCFVFFFRKVGINEKKKLEKQAII